MSRSKTILAFFWVILSLNIIAYSQEISYTQEEVDTLQIRPLNKDKLFAFKLILQSQPELKGWVKYYSSYSYFKLVQKEEDSCIFYGQKAIGIYTNSSPGRVEDERELYRAYYAMGRAYDQTKQYELALEHLLKAKELVKKYPIRLKGYIDSGIANSHLALGNDSLAITHYWEALRDTFFVSNARSKITALMRIGASYGPYHLNRIDSSKHYLHKAAKLAIQSGQKNNLGATFNNLGDVFKEEGQVDSAVFYYMKAHETLKEHQPITKEGKSKTNLFNKANYAYVKIYSDQLEEAIDDLNELLGNLANFTEHNKNDKGLFIAVYDNLAQAYQKKGEIEKMRDVLLLKEQFLEEFHKTELKMELEKLQLAFETQAKESKIKRLEILTADQETIRIQQLIIFTGIALLLLLTIAALWIYLKQRTLRGNYRQVVLQQQLLRTQLDPHFLYNCLNTAVVLSKQDPKNVAPYLNKLGSLMRLILNNSRSEFVPLKEEIEALEAYLELQSASTFKFNYTIELAEELEGQIICIPPMLIQPFVENAIQHGISLLKHKGRVDIRFKSRNSNTMICEIEDNGIGYSSPKNENVIPSRDASVSIDIIQNRLLVYNKKVKTDASVEIVSPNNDQGGTLVILILPMARD